MMNNISRLLKKIESVTVLDHSESWGQRKTLKEKQNENKRKNTYLVFIENFDICSSWIFALIFIFLNCDVMYCYLVWGAGECLNSASEANASIISQPAEDLKTPYHLRKWYM